MVVKAKHKTTAAITARRDLIYEVPLFPPRMTTGRHCNFQCWNRATGYATGKVNDYAMQSEERTYN